MYSVVSLLTIWFLWTDTWLVLLMSQHSYMWETPSCFLSYKFQLFSMRFVLGVCFALCFAFWASPFWSDESCAWFGCFLWFGQLFWSHSGPLPSTKCLSPLIFIWTCFSKLLNCIPAYSLSLLLNYHQVTYRAFHSPIRYCKVSFPYMLFLTFVWMVHVLLKFKYVWFVYKTYHSWVWTIL